jgi:hypothetical protein
VKRKKEKTRKGSVATVLFIDPSRISVEVRDELVQTVGKKVKDSTGEIALSFDELRSSSAGERLFMQPPA